MEGQWQLFVTGIEGKTKLFTVTENCTVRALFDAISKQYDIKVDEFQLSFCAVPLDHLDGNKHLADYKIVNKSTLVLLLRLVGGWSPLDALSTKKRELQPLDGFITVTTNPDMITFDDDKSVRRARMPCGHVIGPDSMTLYARSLVDAGNYTFMCPYVDERTNHACNAEWQYFLVRHVACLSPDEMAQFEMKLAENYFRRASGIQKCPGCDTWCTKDARIKNCVRCTFCQRNKPGTSAFCWVCLKPWCGSANDTKCGNDDCNGVAARVRCLAVCSVKTIGGVVGCPSVRGCPKCGLLIAHNAGCKHMTCSACKYEFCFICLQKWKCWSWFCWVAKRQTTLVGM